MILGGLTLERPTDRFRLPGSPMWLLALYSPYFSEGLEKAGRYFVPPLWYGLRDFALFQEPLLIQS